MSIACHNVPARGKAKVMLLSFERIEGLDCDHADHQRSLRSATMEAEHVGHNKSPE